VEGSPSHGYSGHRGSEGGGRGHSTLAAGAASAALLGAASFSRYVHRDKSQVTSHNSQVTSHMSQSQLACLGRTPHDTCGPSSHCTVPLVPSRCAPLDPAPRAYGRMPLS